jgi:hypothetical protein
MAKKRAFEPPTPAVTYAAAFVTRYRLDAIPQADYSTGSYANWGAGFAGEDWANDAANADLCVAARAAELLILQKPNDTRESLRDKMLNRMCANAVLLIRNGVLESDVRGLRDAVEECITAGATPLACMRLVLETTTPREAAHLGW